MTYSINNSYKEKMIHQKGIADNSVTCTTFDCATEGMGYTLHNINGEVV